MTLRFAILLFDHANDLLDGFGPPQQRLLEAWNETLHLIDPEDLPSRDEPTSCRVQNRMRRWLGQQNQPPRAIPTYEMTDEEANEILQTLANIRDEIGPLGPHLA